MGNTIRGIIAFIPSNTCQKYLLGDLEEMPIDKMVDLSSMQLRRFPLRVCAFTELVKLYLSDNNLNNLPPELELLQNLQILALDFNNFKVLPLVVCSLKQLCILYLGNNHIRDLPQELCYLKNLHTLWIESNYLTHFPSFICELTLLKTLHIGCNQIRNIPMELKNLVELRSIWMSGNLLTEFPPVLLQMPFLDIIDVDRNGIRFFPSLMHLTGLKLVIYDHNPCQNAPKVAKGVRRVGRWSEESPEPKKRFEVEAELEKAAEDKDTQPAESNEPPAASSDIPQEATSALTIKDN
ncbi:leucine-rich repeat-containing protein 10 isoform X1 [Hyla sarda]|uniref:leucine-rich repeat-containing protein 10 isoform X1 n=1 Tax=Hyla sarda TaxID=327740 RepID=UPI0024C257EC|nr:leucine-rich repeat-containing protein 10 isoform X1 [Hyla sarda]